MLQEPDISRKRYGKRNLSGQNRLMATKIAQALRELPIGVKSRCCEVLVRNPLWQSLDPTDWLHFKDVLEIILQECCSGIDSSNALLFTANKSRDATALHNLLDTGINNNASALEELQQMAIMWDDDAILKRLSAELLCALDMSIPGIQFYGEPFRRTAITHGDLTGVRKFHRSGIATVFAQTDGLVFAISERPFKIVDFLVQNRADLGMGYSDIDLCSSALGQALASKAEAMWQLLLRYGADPNDEEVLCHASMISVTVLETFIRSCDQKRLVKKATLVFFEAIQDSDLNKIRLLLDHSVECYHYVQFGQYQMTCLAAEVGVVQRLLSLGTNANDEAMAFCGLTALQIAASGRNIGIASLLLEQGADVNAKGAKKRGKTAVEAAAENDRLDMVRFLVDLDAHITGRDARQSRQARSFASERGHFVVCKLLDNLCEAQSGQLSPFRVSASEDVDFDYSFRHRDFHGFHWGTD